VRAIDISAFAADADEYVRRVARRGGAPLLIADGQEPLAVIIRHQVYAPRLKAFEVRQDGDLTCRHCPGTVITVPNPHNLGSAAETANQHYRDAHQEQQ
jgi:hypothetical protein